ncbi:FAD-dependent oxidoreductase [Acidovorax sp. SUPP950]|uniref:NAD(P)/FAD-dependent oxidoreductase n=1 Tax=Acidovorax sp. SUPP950 TaxID=511901 RepID=UPI0023C6CCC1|nr:FAD-dependent oxidoreductase [Acidovorax sp. SUPP950]GKS77263.1 FAD-dependent oxidoreductase [Acidovorax sp. SUPP950]
MPPAPAQRSKQRLRRSPSTETPSPQTPPSAQARRFAVIGAGMAGIVCARTLVQAGHEVTVFEKAPHAGGRTTTLDTAFGSFDAGAQYFTVRDSRFERALETVPGLCRPWSANTVRVLDAAGRVAAAAPPPGEPHWVASPGMQSLVDAWSRPLSQAGRLLTGCRVTRIERDSMDGKRWQLRTESPDGAAQVHAGFDAVLLAQPSVPALALLQASGTASGTTVAPSLHAPLAQVTIAPCWTLMLAFPQAVRPGLTTLGPQWNAARSTHHRIAWLARESSKPGRGPVERWTVQASPAWSREHLEDGEARVQAKLTKAFSEVTGIRAEPAHAEVCRWRYAQTLAPLGRSHLWDAKAGIGLCGDWCLGHRLEDAFVSGLELALAVA